MGGRLRARSRWWLRMLAWLRALFRRQARALPPSRRERDMLPDDLRDQLDELALDKGAVADSIQGAIRDYLHIRQVLLGPGASDSAVDDAALLAEAEVTLRSMMNRAGAVATLVRIAVHRTSDRPGRQATGVAMLHLRDQGRALHDTASAAIRWAATRDASDAARLRGCAVHLHAVTERAERTTS